jgi:hypothetical protein
MYDDDEDKTSPKPRTNTAIHGSFNDSAKTIEMSDNNERSENASEDSLHLNCSRSERQREIPHFKQTLHVKLLSRNLETVLTFDCLRARDSLTKMTDFQGKVSAVKL